MKALRRFTRRAIRRANRQVSRLTLAAVADATARPARLRRLGSDYGGWTLPEGVVRPDWICYCVGVGTDASFDLALAAETGAGVHAFDPTPAAIAYMESLAQEAVSFHPWGIWNEDGEQRFFAPPYKGHGSHSVYDLHLNAESFVARCYRLSTVMERLGHERIDLLKLDIEGSWGQVLEDMLATGIRPKVLCVEFDSPAPVARVYPMARRLIGQGYVLAHRDKDNVLFLHASLEAP